MDYIDSCVIIAAYFPNDPNHEIAEKYFEELKLGKRKGIISIFGICEIAGFISRNSSPEDSLKFIKELIKLPNFYIWYALDFKEFMNSCTSLAISRGLSGADSIHAISSLSILEVKRFITLDSHFRKISDLIEVVKPDGNMLL